MRIMGFQPRRRIGEWRQTPAQSGSATTMNGGVGGMAGTGVHPPKTRAVSTVAIHAGRNTGGPTIASRSAAWKSARVTSIRTTAFRPTIGKVASNGRSDWDADRDDRDWDRDRDRKGRDRDHY